MLTVDLLKAQINSNFSCIFMFGLRTRWMHNYKIKSTVVSATLDGSVSTHNNDAASI